MATNIISYKWVRTQGHNANMGRLLCHIEKKEIVILNEHLLSRIRLKLSKHDCGCKVITTILRGERLLSDNINNMGVEENSKHMQLLHMLRSN